MATTSSTRKRRLLSHERNLEGTLLLTQGLGLVTSILVSRALGPVGRGTLTSLAVWGQTLGWACAFSLDKAFVVVSRNDDSLDDRGWFRTAGTPALAGACLAALVSFPLGSVLFTDVRYHLLLAAASFATVYTELVAGWFLRARSKRTTFLLFRLSQPALYLVGTACVLSLLSGTSLHHRTFATAAALVISIAVPPLAFCWACGVPMRPRIGIGLKRLALFALMAQGANALQYINNRMDLLFLGAAGRTRDVGLYAAGAALGQAVLFIGTAATIRGFTGQRDRFDWGGLAVVSVLAGCTIAAAPIAIPIAFGHQFAPAIRVGQTLAIGAIVNYALQSHCGRLLGASRPNAVTLVHGLGVPAFALGIAIRPTLDGVAVASVSSYVVSLIAATILMAKTPPGPVVESLDPGTAIV